MFKPGPSEVHLAHLFAAPDSSRSSQRWNEFSESKDLTADHMSKKTKMTRAPSPLPISHMKRVPILSKIEKRQL